MTTPPEPPPAPGPQEPRPDTGSHQPPHGDPTFGQATPPGQGGPGYGQPGPGQGQYGYTPQGLPAWGAGPNAPYGVDPRTGIPYSDKSRILGGILQLFFGLVGAGRWYTGNYGMAVAQLLTCGGLGVWALVDGIYMLVGSAKDSQGRPLRP